MAEVDYQIALLLQYKFEQEKTCLSDSQLAKALQEQFEKEYAIEKPGQNLVYDKNNEMKTKDSTKSLTDPSWEVIDPTPDIHTLFIAFNERFFWNKLLAVCVSWSKRMTSCAGICSYSARGGMCSITLSEPLLKLRPRKDLVETLLHEMIHAFLFVTHSNRDRDGHGPEFHKHMYRINAAAGTNITVYHDFHDEVKLYKQHWWRCNGPCQKQKPFFGMVRRAMNRPPGPNDRWWSKHAMDCGGSFIKVKEPEKTGKTSTKSLSDGKTKQDIRNFIPKLSGPTQDNVRTISNNNSNPKIDNVVPKSSNIFGFTNLNNTCSTSRTKASGTDPKGSIRINSSTVVINKKPATKDTESVNSKKVVPSGSTSKPQEGSIKSNSSTVVINKKPTTKHTEAVNSKKVVPSGSTSRPQKEPSDVDYSVVRNHWINKFPAPKSGEKRSFVETDQTSSKKLPKLSPTFECPICAKLIPEELLNTHIDNCLLEDNLKVCIICERSVPLREHEDHVKKCAEEAFEDEVFEAVPLPSEKTSDNNKITNKNATRDSDEKEKECEVCKQMISMKNYPIHVNECFHKMYDNIEAGLCDNEVGEETIECLACSDKILKSELDSHLEDCLSMSRIFDDENEPTASESIEKETKCNCPFCTKLFSIEEMSDHIDVCLGIVDLCGSPS